MCLPLSLHSTPFHSRKKKTMNEFATIKQILCEKNELWEDPEFRAVQSSVFYHQTPPFQFQWRRPKELCPEPVFVTDDDDDDDDSIDTIGLSDIEPGKMGDQWLVNCFAILRQNNGLFYRAVPADQSFGPDTQYAGIFRFRIWWCGEWIEVTVDDRLPTINNKLAFLHSNRTGQFWPSLLEKAYAKLHGSYEALKYGSFLDGLADLTGGIAESLPVPLDLNHCLKMLYNFSNVTSIVTCIVQDVNGSQKKNRTKNNSFLNGIEPDTNYGFNGIEKVTKYNGDLEIFVRLRHPLEKSFDQHPSLNGLKSHEFAMPLKEFARAFTHWELIHLDRETSRDETRLCTKQSWLLKTVHGFWQKGVTAGGCRNNTETFHINPQLLLILNESDEVIISLNQHSVLEPTVIGFTLYQLESTSVHVNEPLPISFFNRTKSLQNSQYSNTRQISQRCRLQANGTDSAFLLMPTTFEPGQESKFTLRILSRTVLKLKLLDLEPMFLKCAISKAPFLIEARNFGQFEQAFLQLADEHRSINAFDLLELLDACLPNDYIRSCATLDVCRQIVLTFDISNNGRMKFKDFKDFMFSLKNWQNIFKNFTKEKSGVLKAEKFRDAIKGAGYVVSAEILSILCHRHIRKDGTFRFGDFVSAILHLITAFRIFESKNVMQNGSIKMTLSEVSSIFLLLKTA